MSFGQSNFGYSSGGLSPTLVSALNAIPSHTWSTIGLINQGLATTSSPSFYDLNIDNLLCIGTSFTPSERLHVQGNIRAEGSLKLDSGAFQTTIAPTTLGASRTLTLPDSDLTLTAHSGPNQALSTNNMPTFASGLLINTYTNSGSHPAEELSKLTLGHSGYSVQLGAYLPQDNTVNGMCIALSTPDNTGTLHRQIFIGSNDGHSGRVVIGSSVLPTERLCVEGNIRATGSLKLDSGAFTASITPLTLTGNTTVYLPDSNLTLTQWSGPNQDVSSTAAPTFADITVTDHLSFPDLTAAKNMTLVGYQAGGANALTSYSHYSTLVGYRAGASLNGVLNTTALGWKALTAVTTGASNTAVGCSAGLTLTTGQQNTLVGAFTDTVGTGTIYSIGLGYSNLCASGCIFIGRNIGASIQSGATNNVVIGPDGAGGALTSGASNTCVGQSSGASINTGTGNTCMGLQAGNSVSSADYNACFGYQSGTDITTGGGNTAVGYKALSGSAGCTGAGNVAIGHSSMSGGVTSGTRNACVGIQSGLAVTSGVSNTFIGDYTGTSITTGNYNVCLGAGANISPNGDGGVSIGLNAVAAPGTVQFGTANAYSTATIGCSGGWSSSSDARLKCDIDDLKSGLDIIAYLRPRKYKMKQEKKMHFGFIAQEMQSVLPQAVVKQSDEMLAITHNMLLAPIVRAIQELDLALREQAQVLDLALREQAQVFCERIEKLELAQSQI